MVRKKGKQELNIEHTVFNAQLYLIFFLSSFLFFQVMRCSHASTASDMWSLGVILYMMLSGGVSPFWAGSEYRTQRRVIRGIYNLGRRN